MTAKTTNVKIVRDETGVQIATYNRTTAALASLEEKYKGMVFEVTTTKGMKEAKAVRKELKDLRVNLEKDRQEKKGADSGIHAGAGRPSERHHRPHQSA